LISGYWLADRQRQRQRERERERESWRRVGTRGSDVCRRMEITTNERQTQTTMNNGNDKYDTRPAAASAAAVVKLRSHSTTPTHAILREYPREDVGVGVVECGLYWRN